MSNGSATLDKATLEAFRRDIISLFISQADADDLGIERSGGKTSRWTYLGHERPAHHDSGASLWRQFVDAQQNRYYIPGQEAELIAHYTDTLVQRFKDADTLVDLGSGSRFAVENKTLPLLKKCPDIGLYIPVDLSQDLLDEAEAVARELAPDKEVIPINGDFYYRQNGGGRKTRQEISFPERSRARAGVMFGSTISNMNMTLDEPFPTENIEEKIRDLGYLLKKGATGPTSLTLAYDSNQDFNGTVAEAYKSIHWKRMIVGLMIDVQTILKPRGFDAFGWEYEGVPDRSKSVIHQCVRATKNMAFTIPDEKGNEIAFKVNAGDRFVIVNNIKYQPEHMADLIRGAGYKPEKPLRLNDNHMVLHTMEIPHSTNG